MKDTNVAKAKLSQPDAPFLARQLAYREQLREMRRPPAIISKFTPENAPLVSIIVLNRNGAQILPRCIDFLLTQTYPRFEILVVDNGSTDTSREVVHSFAASGKVRLLESKSNLGVAGGRNFGMREAKGEILAFIDNDGYAAADWLEQAMLILNSSAKTGAVGSLVFFNRNKLVVNGACATQNRQWYAGDLCFNQPYEFAELPREVLYPMGCGMLIRRSVAQSMGPLDESTPKWFDDTELGMRVWLMGYSVTFAPNAVVDHDFHTSHSADPTPGWQIAFAYERARLRMAIKYQKLPGLARWIASELKLIVTTAFSANFRNAPVLLLAWAWNAKNLPSALKIRRSFAGKEGPPQKLIDPSWGSYPAPMPENHKLKIELPAARAILSAAEAEHYSQLHYGFYSCERFEGTPVLWSNGTSAALLRTSARTSELSCFIFPSLAPYSATVSVRVFGERETIAQFEINQLDDGWREYRFELALEPECYEILFQSTVRKTDRKGREISFGLGEIALR